MNKLDEKTYTLCLFEGEKTEPIIFKALQQRGFITTESNTQLICSYKTDIYQLYKEINPNDGDSDLNLFGVLLERPDTKDALSQIDESQIDEIFLFFDYDGHAPEATDDKIRKLLDFFNDPNGRNEENTQLFISYPMVEALRHVHSQKDFSTLTSKVKLGRKYKKRVNTEGEYAKLNIKNMTREQWLLLMIAHGCKANALVNGNDEFPEKRIDQLAIFQQQQSKHIEPHQEIAVLSAFPLFLLEHFPCDDFKKELQKQTNTTKTT